MTLDQRRLAVTAAIFALAAALLIAAIILVMGSLARWRAHAALAEIGRARLLGDAAALVEAKRQARGAAPGIVAIDLAAIDLADPEQAVRLQAMLRRADRADRPLIEIAAALAALHAGQPPPSLAGPDGALIALAAGSPPAAGTSAPPPGAARFATQAVCLPRILAAAWDAGDGERVRGALGALALLQPRHPERAAWIAVLAGLDPGLPSRDLAKRIQALPDAGQRERVAEAIAVFAPARTADLAAFAQPGGRLARRLAGPDRALEETLAAKSTLSVDARLAAAARAIDRGRGDLAAGLLDGIELARWEALRPALAQADGQLGTRAAIGGVLRTERGDLVVQVGGRDGAVPAGTATALAGAAELPTRRIAGQVVIAAGAARIIALRLDTAEVGAITVPGTP